MVSNDQGHEHIQKKQGKKRHEAHEEETTVLVCLNERLLVEPEVHDLEEFNDGAQVVLILFQLGSEEQEACDAEAPEEDREHHEEINQVVRG